MMDSMLGILGIVVSILLFLIGYRQTVGAKKERIATCNADVEKILVRRIVLEGFKPTPLDVERLIEGKARDFRVREVDLHSEGQVLNSVYTRVVESDLIPGEQRNEIIGRIVPALSETEGRGAEGLDVRTSRAWLSQTSAALSAMAVLASVAGALVAALPELANLDTHYPTLFQTLIVTAAASLGIITTWLVVYRVRNSQEELPTRGTEIDQYLRFEREVEHTLKRLGLTVRRTPPEMPGDFLAEQGERRFLVEVRSWPRRVPAKILSELVRRLKQAAESADAEVLIVTRAPMIEAADVQATANVRFLTVRQLREYVTAQQQKGSVA